jgi:hypothetical protein
MFRILKYIPLFFLFLAAFIFNVHMIIPHDHHSADVDACHENSYPVSDNNKGHHSGFPVHCHVFNGLASEKAVSYYIIRNTQNRAFEASSVFDISVPNHPIYCLRIFEVVELPVDSFILELSSLRAPPSVC